MIMLNAKQDRPSNEQNWCAKELRGRLDNLRIGRPVRLSKTQVRHTKELGERINGMKGDGPSGPTRKPTVYTDELGERIVDHMIDLKSIREIGKVADMPPARLIYRWSVDQKHPFYSLHRRAREMQSWVWADVLQDIIPSILDRSVCPQRARLAFKFIVWLCERFNPEVFCRNACAAKNTNNQPSGIMLREEYDRLNK